MKNCCWCMNEYYAEESDSDYPFGFCSQECERDSFVNSVEYEEPDDCGLGSL